MVENINKVKKCESLIKFECVVGEIYLRNHERQWYILCSL